ncbi:hypothetical protein L1049_018854 [Liquidambar formosana]|uniref:RINT1-like protein MAG2L n=1 Tax=Liquidambar formosana TaxID=63359 RepID=A0AAP0RBE5_LIQFO
MEPPLVLPNHRDLSPHLSRFLDDHFSSHQDLSTAFDLETQLSENYADLNSGLAGLQKNLTKLVVSWISRSFTAKSALHRLSLNVHNLGLYTSQYGIGSKKMRRFLGEELPQLAKEVRRIETVRNYAETTLELEALVGDLEDAVFCIMNRHAGSMFSVNLSYPSNSVDSGAKQERLLQAVKAMNDIEDVLINVTESQPQWHHLPKSVDTRVDKVLAVLRPQVLAEHRALLASLGWPPKLLTSNIDIGQISELQNPLLLMQGDKRKSYSQSFLTLCALQHLQTRREDRKLNLLVQKEYKIGLWAIDEMVSPIASQTEYHFLKWVDQPEFIFALVYRITSDLVLGVDLVLQPLIDRARLVSYSAKEAWVFAMVRMLAGFLAKRVFSVLAERYKEKHLKSEVISSWLHLIDLIVTFDKRMQSLLNSEPESFEGFSKGISVLSVSCDRPDWIDIWAKMELKDAWKKLKVELKDERAWLANIKHGVEFHVDGELDQFLLSTREDHKAPLIAESAIKIAWEMIERCQTLQTVSLRIQFIRSTAASFFWYFFNVLLLRCKRPEFPSDYPDDDALVRICGSINAARYIESKLQEWSDDVNLLEMRIAENGSNIHMKDDVSHNTVFFSEEIKALAELQTNWLMEILTDLLRQFEILSWEYVQNREYFEQVQEDLSPVSVSATMDLAVSTNVVEALDALRSELQVIEMSLNAKDFLDLWRSVADGLDHFILGSILASDINFSDEGVNQFGTDMQALFLVFQPFCVRPEAFFPCIRDSLKLLKLDKEEAKLLQVDLSGDKTRIKSEHFCRVSHLSFDQVEKILRMRKFEI